MSTRRCKITDITFYNLKTGEEINSFDVNLTFTDSMFDKMADDVMNEGYIISPPPYERSYHPIYNKDYSEELIEEMIVSQVQLGRFNKVLTYKL